MGNPQTMFYRYLFEYSQTLPQRTPTVPEKSACYNEMSAIQRFGLFQRKNHRRQSSHYISSYYNALPCEIC